MYSLLTVFLAQLHHTVSGLSFSRVRILWFFGNVLLYVLTLIFIVLSLPRFVFMVFFACSLLIVSCIGLYSYSIYKQLQGPHLMKAADKVDRVVSRFLPLVGICAAALLVSSIYYMCMALQIVTWYELYNYYYCYIITHYTYYNY